jgi:hypothetical protein
MVNDNSNLPHNITQEKHTLEYISHGLREVMLITRLLLDVSQFPS